MDFQQILNIALSGISGALGWFCREMYLAVQNLKSDLSDFKVEIAKEYVPRPEMMAMKKEILDSLYRIEDKLQK